VVARWRVASTSAHRFVWDLRYERPRAPTYEYSIGTAWGANTPVVPQGALVPPGQYQVRLRVDGTEYQAALSVRADPRVGFDPAGSVAALDLLRNARDGLAKLTDASLEVDYLKQQLDATEKQASTKSAKAAIAKVRKKLEPLVKGEGDTGPALEPIAGAARALQRVEAVIPRRRNQRAVLPRSTRRLERALTLAGRESVIARRIERRWRAGDANCHTARGPRFTGPSAQGSRDPPHDAGQRRNSHDLGSYLVVVLKMEAKRRSDGDQLLRSRGLSPRLTLGPRSPVPFARRRG
jgi:hypothetical protein